MCVSSASTGPCGGQRVTAVPTATGGLQPARIRSVCENGAGWRIRLGFDHDNGAAENSEDQEVVVEERLLGEEKEHEVLQGQACQESRERPRAAPQNEDNSERQQREIQPRDAGPPHRGKKGGEAERIGTKGLRELP